MPDWTTPLRARLTHLHLRGEREADIVEELSQHLDERYDELRRAGHADDEAQRIALDDLIAPDTLVQQLRPLHQARIGDTHAPGASRGAWLATLWSDLRYAARSLRQQPGFVLVAVLTIALGIGANSAIFALADATLLRPLPLREPDRLVSLWEQTQSTPRGGVSPLNLLDWNARNDTFDGMAAYVTRIGSMVMAGNDGVSETVPRQWVSAGIFEVMGIEPVIGRTFTWDDDRARLDAVVLSESWWRSRFDADPGIVGRDLRLDGDLYRVLGVVPDSAQLIGRTSLWGLTSITDAPPRARGAHFLRVIGRLKDGITQEAALANMQAVSQGLAREYPDTNANRSIALEPLHDAMVGNDLSRTALLFLGVVGFVLLICCVNVTNLLLARATARSRELAIRTALGANRWHLTRQVLTESLLLAIAGCVIGLALGWAILRMAPAMLPEGLLPGAVTLAFDLRVVAFCTAAALVIGVLFGLAPAWQATRLSPAETMGSETRGNTGRSGRLRGLIVVFEVAMAVVLLFGAGLLLRTLMALQHEDRGYRADGTLTMLVDPLGERYPTAESLLQFFDDIQREVEAIPDVQQVAWASSVPLGEAPDRMAFDVVGAPLAESERPVSDYQIVSPSYLPALGIGLVAGRALEDGDRSDGIQVALVNEAFVRAHLHGIDPIGTRIALHGPDAPEAGAIVREIVGVAEDVKSRATDTLATPQIYAPLAQAANSDMLLIVRSASGNATALVNPVRAALARIDTEQLVSIRDVRTLDAVAREATARHRFRAVLVITFAGLALLLAMVGVFGILAYSVQQRTREVGVRMALGASTRNVLGVVVRSAAWLVAAGTALGLVLAMLMAQALHSVLYGVAPLDPLTFLGVAVVLAIAAALAMLAPAFRATRLDPLVALRGH